jgi:hypothetical protein
MGQGLGLVPGDMSMTHCDHCFKAGEMNAGKAWDLGYTKLMEMNTALQARINELERQKLNSLPSPISDTVNHEIFAKFEIEVPLGFMVVQVSSADGYKCAVIKK